MECEEAMRESCLELKKYSKPGPPPGRKYKDFSGQKIGNLTIIKRVERPSHIKSFHSYWLCRCSCGNELYLPTYEFNRKQQCNECANKEMRRKLSAYFKDLTNKRFGKLQVLKKVDRPKNIMSRVTYWLCQCDCGHQTITSSGCLTSGKTISCGCYNKARVNRRKSAFSRLMQTYIHSADKRGYEFLLTENQFHDITQKNCYYCGNKPSNKIKTCNDEYLYSGLDRVNNNKGYILDNVVPCCETCNKAKRVMSDVEFKQWIIRIYNYWANK